jgi:preprotein translocase subunit SecF
MIQFLKYKKIYYGFSTILILISFFSLIFFGLNMGIEFQGGSIMEVEYQERPSLEEVRSQVSTLNLGEVFIQPVNDNSFVIRTKEMSEESYKELKNVLGEQAQENYFESIGPTIGQELRQKSIVSILLASLAIVLYIAFTFSGIGGQSVKSWQYGLVAAGVGFFHDVLIVLGFFSLVGRFYGVQVTVPVAVALLTILGYSINDTVVIFDRIRENLNKRVRSGFNEIVNASLNETLSRSINTSLTTLLVLLAVFFLGGETLRWFIAALILGISLGTYSSIFIAGPLLSSWFGLKSKKNA